MSVTIQRFKLILSVSVLIIIVLSSLLILININHMLTTQINLLNSTVSALNKEILYMTGKIAVLNATIQTLENKLKFYDLLIRSYRNDIKYLHGIINLSYKEIIIDTIVKIKSYDIYRFDYYPKFSGYIILEFIDGAPSNIKVKVEGKYLDHTYEYMINPDTDIIILPILPGHIIIYIFNTADIDVNFRTVLTYVY